MYHIRRADDHDERSLHMENDLGFRRAVSEAYLRTHHTGMNHEIVDDNGKLVYITEIELLDGSPEIAAEVPASSIKPKKPVPWLNIFVWAWIAAALLFMVISR